MSDRQLFILSGVRWNFTWQRHHSLARAAADSGYDVTFVLPVPRSVRQIVGYLGRRARRLPAAGIPHPRPDGVTVSTLYAVLFQQAGRRLRGLVRPGASRDRDAVVICYVPSLWLPLAIWLIGPTFVVYDIVVLWERAPKSFYPPRWSRRVEAWLARQAQVRLASDSELVADSWAQRGVTCRTVLPAVDEEFLNHRWSRRDESGEIVDVGYFGALVSSEIDFEVFSSHRRLGRSLHVVGPADPGAVSELSARGVEVQRPVDLATLVNIVDTWDALLLPYRGDLSRGGAVTPAKLLNSLATGRTVFLSGVPIPSGIADHCDVTEVGDGQVALRWRDLDDLPTWGHRLTELLSGGCV